MADLSAQIAAHLARERAEWEAARRAAEARLDRGGRRPSGASVRYSLRLDPAEVEALEGRAAVVGIPPSVLARNLIRIGLRAEYNPALPLAVRRVQDAVEELRALIT